MYIIILIGINKGLTLFAKEYRNGIVTVSYNKSLYTYARHEYEKVDMYGKEF